VTPPVCVPAYCAASIAKSKPLQTGFEAFKLALAGFLIPYIFVFNQALLMRGTFLEVATVTLVLLVSIIFLAGGLSGYLFRPLKPALQVLCVALSVGIAYLCALPDLINAPAVRIVILLFLATLACRYLFQRMRQSKAMQQNQNASSGNADINSRAGGNG
jgi:TRAP-type uncharacterized transport system fused permease subunit